MQKDKSSFQQILKSYNYIQFPRKSFNFQLRLTRCHLLVHHNVCVGMCKVVVSSDPKQIVR